MTEVLILYYSAYGHMERMGPGRNMADRKQLFSQ